MPFYETGAIEKNPIGIADIEIISKLITAIKPDQIYAAGDLSDPHGTHRVCLDAIFKSIDSLKKSSFMSNCWLWLYRGAWQEWSVEEIEMAVPLSPSEVLRKKKAIFKRYSKGGEMYQEGFGGELKGKAKQKFEKARKENAEVLGYKLTGKSDINEVNIKDIQSVLKKKQAKKINGMYMDMTTANAIMTVYKALNKSNQKKFTKLPLRKMVDVTWKLVK